MQATLAQSPQAAQAYQLVANLQHRFVSGLEHLAHTMGSQQRFSPVQWLRDSGSHGGGIRFETADGDLFGRGSVNLSQVHYDNNPDKKLGSATAISTIIHPRYPKAPSIHIHISWTEMKHGKSYWRIMADLNPSSENRAHTAQFISGLQKVAAESYATASAQGEHYFFIPALNRHRGVAHFYLENYNSGCPDTDLKLATTIGEQAIDTYLDILQSLPLRDPAPSDTAAYAAQLAYHTLYFFQVLTLDRGTTSGLLVHDQNDLGIMGSLPAVVDRALLQSWVPRLPFPQNQLLQNLIAILPETQPTVIDGATKLRLAEAVRHHYMTHPEAIDMQASGYTISPTVKNHQ